MSGLDVEALLDSTANESEAQAAQPPNSHDVDDRHKHERRDRRDRGLDGHGSQDQDRERKRGDCSGEKDRERRMRGVEPDQDQRSPRSDRGPPHNGNRSKRRSRSRGPERRDFARDRHRASGAREDAYRSSGGDFYRGEGRSHGRSHSPDDRYYRPSGRERRDRDEREDDKPRDSYPNGRGREGDGRRARSPRKDTSPKGGRSKSKSPQLTEDERDRRTVFVQQLAARLRTKELIAFFENVGPVKEAQIVKDRVSGRSKGVGYVEFKDEKHVSLAIQLTGQKLLGIPIIAQLTEAEKNRQARTGEGSAHNPNSIPFHRLYVGNIHFSITESDLQHVFEPFGELEFVQLQKEEQGRSRGYGFVQFRDPNHAREALDKMNGFDLAGRLIRVGLGNDKFTPESTANLLQRFHGHGGDQRNFQGSAFSGHGGRGAHAGGAGGTFDRAGGRDNDKGGGGASALDDTDVAGVNFNNYSRDALMRKLARTDEPTPESNAADDKRKVAKPAVEAKPVPVNVNMASRCVVLKHMFDAAEQVLPLIRSSGYQLTQPVRREEGEAWIKELEDDVRAECEAKYGHVVHIALDANSQGDIYVKFDQVQGGENAIKGLNGRFFGGRQISATPVVDAVYNSLFSRIKAM